MPAAAVPVIPMTIRHWPGLLPFMEQANLQNLIDWNIQMQHPGSGSIPQELWPVMATVIPSYICPSHAGDPVTDLTLTNGSTIKTAGACYAMVQGNGLDGQFHSGRGPANGLCWVGAKIRIADIIDGTSNTIAFVETTIGPGKNATPPDPSVEQHADPRKWRAVASASTAVDWLFNGYGTVNGWEGSKSTVWLRGSVPNGAVLAVPLTPNSKIPDFTQQSGKAGRLAELSHRRRFGPAGRRQRPLRQRQHRSRYLARVADPRRW